MIVFVKGKTGFELAGDFETIRGRGDRVAVVISFQGNLPLYLKAKIESQ
jgi:hypothetical protein